MAHYRLRCLESGTVLEDSTERGEFPLSAPGTHTAAFLRADYATSAFTPDNSAPGIFRYRHWLPINRVLEGAGGSITYRPKELGRKLRLPNLYITFNGWWPERGATIPTGTFKEHEAYAVFGRLAEAAMEQTLVVASAGNTARAFLHVAGAHDLPLVVVVPQAHLDEIWTVGARGARTVVVAVRSGGDYTDAIRLADLLSSAPGFRAEGGAKNVARRDGMGTSFLSAAETIGRIPDHYVQAVGSGTGAIAAWEAAQRLVADGGFGTRVPHLHVAQNAPFRLLVDAWERGTRELPGVDEEEAKRAVAQIDAKVLANRTPPWSIRGGLFDAMRDTSGHAYAIDNRTAAAAAALFETTEGIDIGPEAAVATAALIEAAERGTIGRNDCINLNVTGGGYARARRELDVQPLVPDIVAGPELFDAARIAREVEARLRG